MESFWFDVPTFTHSLLISTILYPNVSASILDIVCFPTPGFPVKTNTSVFKICLVKNFCNTNMYRHE